MAGCTNDILGGAFCQAFPQYPQNLFLMLLVTGNNRPGFTCVRVVISQSGVLAFVQNLMQRLA